MISIVMYGRNDSHGYNLHKRVVISLNSLASILTDPDDEIIFVDYNTDEEYPTFPEAVHDLLSEQARSRIRIFRVPPRLHRQLAMVGSPNILDAIARNVGIRRSNPKNRWILSTTSDVVVVPPDPGRLLSEICRDLPDAFYSLSRFDVPEALWETVDRQNGEKIVQAFKRWGEQFHLNEAVTTVPSVKFDSCGDFQLFLRKDLFAIDAFDERMVAGWQHTDANIQHRMLIYRGDIVDFSEFAYAYHCDHMRQATRQHQINRVENDWDYFVENVSRADLTFQREDWGLANADIRETRLTKTALGNYEQALLTVMPAPRRALSHVSRDHSAFDGATVHAAHVLPFLADHLMALPRDSSVYYAGCNMEILRGIAEFWMNAGCERPLMVDEVPLLAGDIVLSAAVLPYVSPVAGDQAAAANILIFDFSVSPERADENARFHELPPSQVEGLVAVRGIFLREASNDRNLVGSAAAKRKYLVINAIHTSIEPLVNAELSASLTTYSTRIRHGFVRIRQITPVRAVEDVLASIGEVVGSPISSADLSLVLSVIASCRRGQAAGDVPDWALTPALKGALEVPSFLADCALSPPTAAALRERCAAYWQQAEKICEQFSGQGCAGDGRPQSRMCNFDDWNDPAWAESARRYGEMVVPPYHSRDRSTWERVQMLHAARLHDCLGPNSDIAIITADPDEFAGRVASQVGHIDYFSLDPQSDLERTSEWRRGLGFVSRSRLKLELGGIGKTSKEPRYKAVMVPRNAAFRHADASFNAILEFSEQVLVPGGILIFSAEYVVNGDGCFPWAASFLDPEFSRFGVALERHSYFRLIGPFSAVSGPDTFTRRATLAETIAGRPHAVVSIGPHERTSSIWVCRRGGEAPTERRLPIATALAMEVNLLRRMMGTELSHWVTGALVVDARAKPGCIVHGPYVTLRQGRLRVTVLLTAGPAIPWRSPILEIATNRRVPIQHKISSGDLRAGRAEVEFDGSGDPEELYEFRIVTRERCDIKVSSVVVEVV